MGDKKTEALRHRRPLEGDWPQEDLEYLGACPVCCSGNRKIAYSGLKDKTFFCAPGTWTSWRCEACDVVYLDPRPSPASISRAYGAYYTHRPGRQSFLQKLLYSIQIGIRHSYLNKRFGYRLKNGLPLGWVAYILLPSQAEVTGNTVRHLPAPVGKNNRFLDIGCGNGDFLKVARSLGYQAEGLEFDPSAREVAAKEGLVVHPNSMPGSGLPSNDYDQITLSHVVEHFHYPVEALTEVFNLLRPKGRVWIQIPNIAAFSLQRFGANSRLLEPPRHLVMLDSQSLKILLEKAGFKNVQLLPTPDSSNFNYVCYASWMIEEGIDPGKTSLSLIPKDVRLATDAMRCSHERTAENAEFVTMIGTKP